MILFFLITAPLNIALGYGLAIYLERARKASELASAPSEHWHETAGGDEPVAVIEQAPVPAVEATPVVAAAPVATAPVAAVAPAPVAVTPAPAPVEAAAAPAEEMQLESDVLAGIEEFRNQLAQMKAAPIDEAAAKTPALAGV